MGVKTLHVAFMFNLSTQTPLCEVEVREAPKGFEYVVHVTTWEGVVLAEAEAWRKGLIQKIASRARSIPSLLLVKIGSVWLVGAHIHTVVGSGFPRVRDCVVAHACTMHADNVNVDCMKRFGRLQLVQIGTHPSVHPRSLALSLTHTRARALSLSRAASS